MGDYTPTTGEVQSVWAAFSEYGGLVVRDNPGDWESRLAEFDR